MEPPRRPSAAPLPAAPGRQAVRGLRPVQRRCRSRSPSLRQPPLDRRAGCPARVVEEWGDGRRVQPASALSAPVPPDDPLVTPGRRASVVSRSTTLTPLAPRRNGRAADTAAVATSTSDESRAASTWSSPRASAMASRTRRAAARTVGAVALESTTRAPASRPGRRSPSGVRSPPRVSRPGLIRGPRPARRPDVPTTP